MKPRTQRRISLSRSRWPAAAFYGLVAIAVMPIAHSRGQALDDGIPAPTPSTEGLWPSAKLTNLLLVRWADQVSTEFELDDEQRAKLRKSFVDRWTPYFEQNREAIQPVVNEFLEMRLDVVPPNKARASAWAERTKPIFEGMRTEITAGFDDIRAILTPAQRERFELRAMQFAGAMTVAEMKLESFRTGEFDPAELWKPPAGHRRHREDQASDEARPESKEKGALPHPEEVDQITLEVRGWERFVADFCRTYGLDSGQRDAAASCLSEMTQRAFAHRDQRRDEIAELERRIAGFSGSDAEREALTRRLVELYGPIDDLFAELKERVEGLPTRSQRAAARASSTPTQTKPAPAPPPEGAGRPPTSTPGRR